MTLEEFRKLTADLPGESLIVLPDLYTEGELYCKAKLKDKLTIVSDSGIDQDINSSTYFAYADNDADLPHDHMPAVVLYWDYEPNALTPPL